MSVFCFAAKGEARISAAAVMAIAGPLAGKMLLSYLDGSITAQTINDIVEGVKRNPTYAKIVEFVQAQVQDWIDASGTLPNDSQLRDLVSDAISRFTMADPGKAAADAPYSFGGRAYFSGDLQAVIGGINDMIMAQCRIIRTDGTTLAYEASFAIRDTYDFDNDRSMFPFYDKYRKDLTALFRSDPATFMSAYNRDLLAAPISGGDAKVGPLNKTLVFTCFMYALEMNGCTQPLFWEAEIPFSGTVRKSATINPPQPVPVPPPTPTPPTPPPIPRPIPKPVPNPPAPAPPPTPRTKTTEYVVQRGDFLRKIAKKFYGNETMWHKIYDANLSVVGSNPNLILPGQKLVIP